MQESEELRREFNFPFTDGIQEAEKVITDAGYRVDQGIIYIPSPEMQALLLEKNKVYRAIVFLMDEWDFDCPGD